MKAIDPTEIIIEKDGTYRQDTIQANPWLRLLGRLVDYALFFALIAFLRKTVGQPGISLSPLEGLVPLEYVAWIPIEAALLSFFGTTPGKWIVGTHLKYGRHLRLDYSTALRRSTKVWFYGIGMGIPIVNAVCLLIAYQRLLTLRTTTWDRQEHIQITHRPIPTWRLGFALAISLIGFAYYFMNLS
ncbi:MAG: RDD family protein [Verrucomicrobiota bacterium]|nr:RDD family protein [Verrucomicrobiota bacterium]